MPVLFQSVNGCYISMIDWALVTGFNWDEGNAGKSAEKPSISQGEAEQVIFNEPLLLFPIRSTVTQGDDSTPGARRRMGVCFT